MKGYLSDLIGLFWPQIWMLLLSAYSKTSGNVGTVPLKDIIELLLGSFLLMRTAFFKGVHAMCHGPLSSVSVTG